MLMLRSFHDEDTAQVRALYERATLATAGHGPWEDDLAAISTTYITPGGCFVVVQEESNIIAMGALRLHGTHESEVKRMRVDPSKQRPQIPRIKRPSARRERSGASGVDRVTTEADEFSGMDWTEPDCPVVVLGSNPECLWHRLRDPRHIHLRRAR